MNFAIDLTIIFFVDDDEIQAVFKSLAGDCDRFVFIDGLRRELAAAHFDLALLYAVRNLALRKCAKDLAIFLPVAERLHFAPYDAADQVAERNATFSAPLRRKRN